MDLTGMIQNPVEDQNSEQKVIERRVCSFKRNRSGKKRGCRSMDRHSRCSRMERPCRSFWIL